MFRPFLCALLCLGLAFAGKILFDEIEDEIADFVENDEILDELRFEPGAEIDDAKLEKLVRDYITENWDSGITNLKDFRWKNCGGIAGGVVSASVSPDPIVVGEDITIAVNASINMTLAKPLKTAVVMRIQIGQTWVKVPCIDNFGSCTYDDICELLSLIPTCPAPLVEHNIPCHCNYTAGDYNLPASDFNLPEGPPPGSYNATARIYDTSNRELVCFSIELTFES